MWLLLRSGLGTTLSCSVHPIVHYLVPTSIPETLSLGSCDGGLASSQDSGSAEGEVGRTDFSRGVRDWSQPPFSSSQLSPVCVMVRSCHIARRNAEGKVGEESTGRQGGGKGVVRSPAEQDMLENAPRSVPVDR
jgi:hypothetical protein